MSTEALRLIGEMTDFNAASARSAILEPFAMSLAEVYEWQEVREIFRRVAAREIKVGSFLQSFADAAAHADLENFVLLLPTAYKLLAKYPTLIEQHKAKPPITEFPPNE
jgi:hypothetical protein